MESKAKRVNHTRELHDLSYYAPPKNQQFAVDPATLHPFSSSSLLKNRLYTGAADKAVNLVGCKSPHHQLPGRVVSISDACGGNEACSART